MHCMACLHHKQQHTLTGLATPLPNYGLIIAEDYLSNVQGRCPQTQIAKAPFDVPYIPSNHLAMLLHKHINVFSTSGTAVALTLHFTYNLP